MNTSSVSLREKIETEFRIINKLIVRLIIIIGVVTSHQNIVTGNDIIYHLILRAIFISNTI